LESTANVRIGIHVDDARHLDRLDPRTIGDERTKESADPLDTGGD
jgi:hypothetical protein